MTSGLDLVSAGQSTLRGTAALILWGGLDKAKTAQEEQDLNDWWTNEHLPERLSIEGFHRTRRYYAPNDSGSQYLVWYEVASLETLTSPDYMSSLNNPTPLTDKFMPILAAMNRSACRILFSATRQEFAKFREGVVGCTIAHIVLKPPQSMERRASLEAWIAQKGWKDLVEHPGSQAIHLFEHDKQTSQSGNATKSYSGVPLQSEDDDTPGRWIVLIEFAEPVGAPFGKHKLLCAKLLQELRSELEGQEVAKPELRFYSLICAASE